MAKMLELGINLSMLLSGNYQAGLTKAGQMISNLQRKTKSYQDNLSKINKYQAANRKLLDITEKLNNGYKGGYENAALYRQYQEAAANVAKYRSELESAGVSVKNLAQNESQLTGQLSTVKSSLERLTAAQAKYEQARAKIFDWGNVKQDFIKSAALIKTFEKPIRVNMDFEQAMADVRAVSNMTQKEFETLKKQALDLGSQTQFTAMQAAQTQQVLSRAGFKTEQVIELMPHVLDLAAADGMDLAQAGSILTRTLRQFNVPVTEAKRFADLMAYTSASASTDVASLGDAMIKFAPTARAVGISPEKTLAMLGSIANSLQEGESGGLALTRVHETIAGFGKKGIQVGGKKGLPSIKIATMDNAGNMRELSSILMELSQKLSNVGKGEQAGIMKEIFGRFSVPMQALMTQVVSGEYAALERGEYTQSNNKAGVMKNIRNDTLQGDITALTSAWEGFMIRVGKPLEGWSRNIVQGLTKALTGINDFITQHSTLMDIVTKVGAGYAAWKIGSTVLNFFGNVINYGKALFELHSALKAVGGAQVVLNMAMNANPVGLIVTAIAGLIALLWNWDSVTQYISGVWRDLVDWWNNTTLADIFSPLVDFAIYACQRLMKPFIDFKNWLADLFAGFNPFNWELPSWLGGGKTGTNQVNNANAALGGYMPPEIPSGRKRALGGMITRPEIALIGEAGPEAVIPLSAGKKTRGLQVLSMAAESLGVNISPSQNDIISTHVNNSRINTLNRSLSYGSVNQDKSYGDITNMLTESEIRPFTSNNESNITRSISPVINITVNAQGNNELESNANNLAGNIYDRVKEALSEIMNNEARLSYA